MGGGKGGKRSPAGVAVMRPVPHALQPPPPTPPARPATFFACSAWRASRGWSRRVAFCFFGGGSGGACTGHRRSSVALPASRPVQTIHPAAPTPPTPTPQVVWGAALSSRLAPLLLFYLTTASLYGLCVLWTLAVIVNAEGGRGRGEGGCGEERRTPADGSTRPSQGPCPHSEPPCKRAPPTRAQGAFCGGWQSCRAWIGGGMGWVGERAGGGLAPPTPSLPRPRCAAGQAAPTSPSPSCSWACCPTRAT